MACSRLLRLDYYQMSLLYDVGWLAWFPVPGCLVWHCLILSGRWFWFRFALQLFWPARFLLETQMCFS